MKIAVAMSGGVDSSVAAALMVDRYGKESVFGVTMKLFCYGKEEGSDKSCCSLDAISDAATVCKQLGIKHYVINLEDEFRTEVIDDFVSSYAIGLTPNPCVRCNQLIKYEYLLARVIGLGAEKLVTGHYARVSHDKNGFHLLKGLDHKKDQSYFLYNLTQEQLSRVEFPVGEMKKSETRALASKYGLKTAHKTESQDICFVTTTTQDFLADRVAAVPGEIVDSTGKVIGHHAGLYRYTIGQRKGLGGGFNESMYVTNLDVINNRVVIGPEEELYRDKLVVESPHWVNQIPKFPARCKAKIRYAGEESVCDIEKSRSTASGADIVVIFAEAVKAITGGQSIVFYEKDEVLGGGIITITSKY